MPTENPELVQTDTAAEQTTISQDDLNALSAVKKAAQDFKVSAEKQLNDLKATLELSYTSLLKDIKITELSLSVKYKLSDTDVVNADGTVTRN